MRTIKIIFLAVLAIVLVTVGFANRQRVDVTLFPAELEPFTQFNASATLPLYAVGFGGLALGILLGFFWEWMREGRQRAEASRVRRERQRLAREVEKLKADKPEGKDEIIQLVDGRRKAS